MACPFFEPVQRMAGWPSPPRMPLGAPYEGVCRAGRSAWTPAETTLRELCNFGYAAGRCRCFPHDAEADAVRFDRDIYILEKNYAPLRFGKMSACDGILRKQADAFLSNQHQDT